MTKVRKDCRDLTSTERARYVAAVKHMHAPPAPLLGTYQKYIDWHFRHADTAHANIRFLAWHRVLILLFEEDLRAADRDLGNDGEITLPYWNWMRDRSLDRTKATGHLWRDDFMGPTGRGPGGKLIDGPFDDAEWLLDTSLTKGSSFLIRNLGASGSLPAADELAYALRLAAFDTPDFNRFSPNSSFRNVLEGFARWRSVLPRANGIHNDVHVWVGGQMGIVSWSPSDPVFFLHHCNVDRIWAQWQMRHPQRSDQYPTHQQILDAKAAGNTAALQIDDALPPWNGTDEPQTYTTEDVLNHQDILESGTLVNNIGYRYDDDPPGNFSFS